MPKKNLLTGYEWTIMKIVWEKKEVSVREVFEQLPEENKRAYTTVQTYMERLAEKKYLLKKKTGLVNFYRAAMKENDAKRMETGNLVNNAFDGSYSRLAAFLFNSDTLNDKDIRAIKNMIKSKEDKNE